MDEVKRCARALRLGESVELTCGVVGSEMMAAHLATSRELRADGDHADRDVDLHRFLLSCLRKDINIDIDM
jgi:hypothetical protein